ncbi:MAG: hypothetical protein OHK0029_30610 [Armatimonadaceae bacterium]
MNRFVCCLLACLLFSAIGCVNTSSSTGKNSSKPITEQISDSLEKRDILKASDYSRILSLSEAAERGDSLSSEDIQWLLTLDERYPETDKLVQYGPSSVPPVPPQSVRLTQIGQVFLSAKPSQYPPNTVDDVYRFALRLIEYGDSAPNATHRGLIILRELGKKEAVSEIRPLLASSNPDIREFAEKALTRLEQ